MPFLSSRFLLRFTYRKLSTISTTKSGHRILTKAQEALTDYLHTTRSLPFVYAEQIARNSIHSLSDIISRIDYSTPSAFVDKFRKFLRYDPVNELELFYESIGISRSDLSSFLPVNKFFISEECQVFDVACALFEFGFPWRRLGKLYKDEIRVFRSDTGVLLERLLVVKCCGFDTAAIIGICGVFPQVLCDGDVELLLEDLKMVLLSFDEVEFPERNDDMWTKVKCKGVIFSEL